MASGPPTGFGSVTPRMFVADPQAQVEFLRAVFDASGDVHGDRPAEIRIGDSLVMVSSAEAREPFPASCTSTSTTSTARTAARSRPRRSAWNRRAPPRTAIVEGWCKIGSATCTRSRSASSRSGSRTVVASRLLTEPASLNTFREGPGTDGNQSGAQNLSRTPLDKPSSPRRIGFSATTGSPKPEWLEGGASSDCYERPLASLY